MRVLVTGAGGFIGHHLVKRLKADGHWVRGVDIKLPEYEPSPADEFKILDLRERDNCRAACQSIEECFSLAANMGGIFWITTHLADIAYDNILINAHMLDAARHNVVKKFLFSSSACVYAQGKQHDANVLPLKEEDAYPADPEPGYGWEKLFAEQLCEYYRLDHHLDVRVVRFHNVYGPCFDGETEVLTKDGFKYFRDLNPDDEIATKNPVGSCAASSAAVCQMPFTSDSGAATNGARLPP